MKMGPNMPATLLIEMPIPLTTVGTIPKPTKAKSFDKMRIL